MADTSFQRVVLKLSGEGLCRKRSHGVDGRRMLALAKQIRDAQATGLEIGIVVGGGNFVRGRDVAKQGIARITGDYMGMAATVINALAFQNCLESLGVDTRVQTAIQMADLAEPYIRRRAMRHLEKGRVVIFAAGTGNPHFTTDTAAALRAVEIGAQRVLKGTKVDGVYCSDPVKNPKATFYKHLTYRKVLEEELDVMDATAFTLCRENGLPIRVFNAVDPGNVRRALLGEDIGTLVTEDGAPAPSSE